MVDDLVRFLRLMKSLNLANNVGESRFVLVPDQNLVMQQIKIAADALILFMLRIGLLLTTEIYQQSLKVCFPENADRILYFPYPLMFFFLFLQITQEWQKASSLLWQAVAKSIWEEKIFLRQKMTNFIRRKTVALCTRGRSLLKLYSELMQLFSKDKSLHVVDACSGAGSYTLACLDMNINCVVLEKCALKARLICQRVKCT